MLFGRGHLRENSTQKNTNSIERDTGSRAPISLAAEKTVGGSGKNRRKTNNEDGDEAIRRMLGHLLT